MPEKSSTFLAEALHAFRGIFALLTGDRGAPRYFDFSEAGVAGSFIPVLGVAAIELLSQVVLGLSAPGDIARGAVQTAIVYAAFIGSSALLLHLIGRRDALQPFVVTYNWTNAALTIVLPFLFLAGAIPALLVTVVVTFIILINIGRMVMTLKAGQIVLLLITQLIGGSISLLTISMLFPVAPGDLPLLQ